MELWPGWTFEEGQGGDHSHRRQLLDDLGSMADGILLKRHMTKTRLTTGVYP
jgi:hypothetical protein